MKVLNLDKLSTKETRQLLIKGVSYPVEDMTVENFIITTKAAESLPEDASLAVQIEATIEMICRSVPSITKTALGGLSLTSLQSIVAFVRGDNDLEGVDTSEEGESALGK